MTTRKGATNWLILIAPVPYAVLTVAIVDVSRLPPAEVGFMVLAVSIRLALSFYLPPLIMLSGIAVASFVSSAFPRLRSPMALVAAGFGIGIAVWGYRLLTEYPDFEGRLSVVAAFGSLAAYYIVCAFGVGFFRLPRAALLMLTVAGACAIAAASWVSEVNYNTIYPTLHLSSFLVTFTTLSFAISTAISALAPRWLQRPRYLRAVFIVGAGLLMLGLCSSVVLATRADRRVLSSHTSLGQIELIRGEIRQPRAHGNVRADACRKTPEFSQAAAMGIFRRHAGLPVFAPDFDPLRFNIVLLMAEAVRFDETGFVKDSATPNIVELAKRGALVASRAYAPSTSTLLTLSSLLSMTFTSHTAVTTMVPPWRSRLREEAATVPELLQSAGYSTFAVLHGFRPEGALQGLADVERVSNKVRPHSRIDRDIASRMIDALASRRHSESKFFGWMFLVAPHLPYVEMFERSDASARDRYRASIAHADAQIGRVLRYLHHSGLLDETIVIVTSDHGEEFREHGNIGHGVNLYEVSSHVPLLIRIPGQSLSETASPTSLTYVFPWLLSYTGGAIGSSARDVIQRDLAPVMAATDGSVIIENISSRADLVALVRGDYLLHHNVLSERTELFDLNNDPTEVVRRAGDVLKDEYRHRLRQYLDVRRCHARIVVTREKLRGADLEASPSDHEPYRQKTAEPPREWKTTAGQP